MSAAITNVQAATLAQCFEWARDHPFYRGLYRAGLHWRDAPPLEKSRLLAALDDFDVHAEVQGLYLVRSGGSSHAPLIFPVDIAENQAQRQALAEALVHAGMFRTGDLVLNVLGYSDLYRSAAILDDLLERCGATTLAVSAHARYEDMIAIARKFRPTHIVGTPSKLRQLAQVLAVAGETLAIPNLVYAGEVMREETRAVLEACLGANRILSLYGAAETGIWAWSIPGPVPGCFAILEGVVVEILNPDHDGFGSVVVSNRYRRRFPVFRYRLGDTARLLTIAGQSCLELKGRDVRSFQFDELTFDLQPVLALAGQSEYAQLHLESMANGRDFAHLKVVPIAGTPLGLDGLEQIRQALSAMLRHDLGNAAVRVTAISIAELYHDPHTAKVPLLVDRRR